MKDLDELRATPAHVVCDHGASQRSCDACECLALDAENEGLKSRVAELECASKSALWDLRAHDNNDEGGYLDSTESDLAKLFPGICLDCDNGLERYPSGASLTCGKCSGSGKIYQSKEGGA